MKKQNENPSGNQQASRNMLSNEPESFRTATDELLKLTFAQHAASSSTLRNTGSNLQQAPTAAEQPALNVESHDYKHSKHTLELAHGHRQTFIQTKAISRHSIPSNFLATFGPFDSEFRSSVPSHSKMITPSISTNKSAPKAVLSGFRSCAPASQPVIALQTSWRSVAARNAQSNITQAKPLEPLRQPRGPLNLNDRGFNFSLRTSPNIRFKTRWAVLSPSSLESLSYANNSTPSTLNSVLGNAELYSSTNPFGALPSTQSPQNQEKRGFVPSHMRLEKNGLASPRSADIDGCHYKGDLKSVAFLSTIPYLENEFNCSLFITNIPLGTSGSDMFDRIRAGAVDALYFCSESKMHSNMAAKLVFANPEGAAHLHSHAICPGIRIGDKRLHVTYNRDGVLSRDGLQTRILLIEGPEDMMTCAHWKLYFDKACVYELDRWLYRPCSSLGRKRMEFRFYRADGQAVTCYQKIRRDEELEGVIQVRYGRDVCADNTFGAWIGYPN